MLQQFAFGKIADKYWQYWFGTNFEEIRKKFISIFLAKIPDLLSIAGGNTHYFELKTVSFDSDCNIVTMFVQKKDRSVFTSTDKEQLHTLFDADFFSDLFQDASQLSTSMRLQTRKFTPFFYFDYLCIQPIC